MDSTSCTISLRHTLLGSLKSHLQTRFSRPGHREVLYQVSLTEDDHKGIEMIECFWEVYRRQPIAMFMMVKRLCDNEVSTSFRLYWLCHGGGMEG
jgi:hypothetical protein